MVLLEIFENIILNDILFYCLMIQIVSKAQSIVVGVMVMVTEESRVRNSAKSCLKISHEFLLFECSGKNLVIAPNSVICLSYLPTIIVITTCMSRYV